MYGAKRGLKEQDTKATGRAKAANGRSDNRATETRLFDVRKRKHASHRAPFMHEDLRQHARSFWGMCRVSEGSGQSELFIAA